MFAEARASLNDTSMNAVIHGQIPTLDRDGMRACSPSPRIAHAHITLWAYLFSCQLVRLPVKTAVHVCRWTENESEHVHPLPGLRMRISQYVHTFSHVSTTACQNHRLVTRENGEASVLLNMILQVKSQEYNS